jgi:hypothetical protein
VPGPALSLVVLLSFFVSVSVCCGGLDVDVPCDAGCVWEEGAGLGALCCALAGKMLAKAKITASLNGDLVGKRFSSKKT